MPRAMGWTAQDQGKQGALGKESLRKEGGRPSRGRQKQRENTEDEIILLIEGAGLAGISSCG